MNFKYILTRFNEFKELVDTNSISPHSLEKVNELLGYLEMYIEDAMSPKHCQKYSKVEQRQISVMNRYINKARRKIESEANDFREDILNDMYPDRYEEPQDPYDY